MEGDGWEGRYWRLEGVPALSPFNSKEYAKEYYKNLGIEEDLFLRLTIPTIDIGFLSLDYLGDISQINNKISLSAKSIHIYNMVVDKKSLNIATCYIDFPHRIEEELQKRSIILD